MYTYNRPVEYMCCQTKSVVYGKPKPKTKKTIASLINFYYLRTYATGLITCKLFIIEQVI